MSVIAFLNIFGVTKILCSFEMVLEGKAGGNLTEPLRSEFLENI